MKHSKIGASGPDITEVTFGTSGLGHMPETYGYGVDDAQARATIHAIFDGPANCIDTSRNYGQGRSEERIGAVIRERGGLPDGFSVSTKLDRDAETGRFDAAIARRSLEQSLAALSLDRVQILHLHDPEHAADLAEVDRALEELFRIRDEGLADVVGLAMGRVDIQLPLLRIWDFDVLINHNRMTLLNRAADDMFDYAHQKGITIINAAPFAGGVLAKGADVMKRITYQPADDTALEPVRRIEALCAQHGVSPGAAALQFSLRDPRIASTIVGVTKPERIGQTLAWMAEPLPEALWQALDALPHTRDDPEANRDMTLG